MVDSEALTFPELATLWAYNEMEQTRIRYRLSEERGDSAEYQNYTYGQYLQAQRTYWALEGMGSE